MNGLSAARATLITLPLGASGGLVERCPPHRAAVFVLTMIGAFLIRAGRLVALGTLAAFSHGSLQ